MTMDPSLRCSSSTLYTSNPPNGNLDLNSQPYSTPPPLNQGYHHFIPSPSFSNSKDLIPSSQLPIIPSTRPNKYFKTYFRFAACLCCSICCLLILLMIPIIFLVAAPAFAQSSINGEWDLINFLIVWHSMKERVEFLWKCPEEPQVTWLSNQSQRRPTLPIQRRSENQIRRRSENQNSKIAPFFLPSLWFEFIYY